MYICPVCGYNKLNYPYTEDGTICPSCGTEFGYDDFLNSHAELRQQWIQQGAQWWSPNRPRPSYWSPLEQLRNIDYAVTDSDRAAIARYSDMHNGRGAPLTLPRESGRLRLGWVQPTVQPN
jgi:hypothetical protein